MITGPPYQSFCVSEICEKQSGSVIKRKIKFGAGTVCLIQNLARREPSLFQNSFGCNCTVNGTGLKFLLTAFEFCQLLTKFAVSAVVNLFPK
jgi:hypothetical protein